MMEKRGNIVILRESPDVTIDDIFADVSKVLEDKTLPEDLRLMVVTEGEKFTFGVEEISKMKPLVKSILSRFKTFRQAFVVKSPITTAYTMIFQNLSQRISESPPNAEARKSRDHKSQINSAVQAEPNSQPDAEQNSTQAQNNTSQQQAKNRHLVEIFSTEAAALKWLEQ
jgi:hypothetical protein